MFSPDVDEAPENEKQKKLKDNSTSNVFSDAKFVNAMAGREEMKYNNDDEWD